MWSKCSWVMRTAFAPARACGSLNALGSITSTAPSLSKRVQACPSLVSRIATPLRIRRCDEHTGIGWAPDGPGALRRAALAPGAAGRAGQVWHRPDRAAGVPDRGGHRAPEHHPGVQRRGGRPGLYIAMRYVPDGDVWTLIDRVGPLPAARACALIAQAASALDAAHARGLVHRDVKPTNMLLEISPRTSRPDHLYLSDFGPAAAGSGAPAGSSAPRAPASSAPTAPASSSALPAPPSPPPPGVLAATVREYYAAINNHRYARAWRLGGRNTGQTYNAFVSGFAGTAHDTVTIRSVSGDVVTAQLAAQQTDGTVKTYQGSYTVEGGVITQFDVRQVS